MLQRIAFSCFILKGLFVLKISKILSWHFGHVEKMITTFHCLSLLLEIKGNVCTAIVLLTTM